MTARRILGAISCAIGLIPGPFSCASMIDTSEPIQMDRTPHSGGDFAGLLVGAGNGISVGPHGGGVSADMLGATLLRRFAPIVHQRVDSVGDHSLGGRADLLADFDFDGDWNGRNNWENLERYPVSAVVYTSHTETERHHFLLYAFFHPRDWTNRWFSPSLIDSEHENDCEAFLCVVAKPDETIVAALSVFHDELHVLLPAGSPLRAARRLDQRLLHASPHDGWLRPVLFQEAEGHGLTGWPGGLRPGPRVIYYPQTHSPSSCPTEEPDLLGICAAPYRLVSVFAPGGWWSHRNDPHTFAQPGRIAGDDEGGCGGGLRACEHDRASAPWGMELAGLEAGAIALDPARLLARTVLRRDGAPTDFASPYRTRSYQAH